MVQVARLLALVSAAPLVVASALLPPHKCPVVDTSIVAHTGAAVGKVKDVEGVDLYITGPKKSKTAVLYLTDVFGIQLNENKLLADSFGRAGFLTVAPDMFQGQPAPGDINGTPDFDLEQFLYDHRPEITDPIIASTINYMRDTLKVEKIAITGYCFGGRYSFRFIADGKGGDVGFAAHPSLLENPEVEAITKPISVAAAQNDDLLPAPARHALEDLLMSTGQEATFATYGGTQHGFGVRANVTDPRQKFAKEEAFIQAVRFFQNWV
ncbi:dienelactone hydrolase [Microdochium trichocladiopsis]|uniref:Dienelactone hydrolase n=1 Tax=Microdochium trichocladiopsis TaxID=1682393 RepID=A0A9P8XUG9_9PEZI|nr:dienelactone hydrolase [Microdochium trichocladiopsis]KAH7018323.1 dienelactone hydrolase [Microdochium trichocladiopsis]